MHRIKPESELKLNISFESNGDYYLGAEMGTTHQVEAGMFLHAMTGKEYYRIDKTISNDLIK